MSPTSELSGLAESLTASGARDFLMAPECVLRMTTTSKTADPARSEHIHTYILSIH